MEYGTVRWARRTGGALTGVDRIRQTALLARYQVAELLRRSPRAVGFGTTREAGVALADIRLPDTELVLACLDLITENEPPSLVGHSIRTYLFGGLFGLRDGVRCDLEDLAIAALLHDLALGRRNHARTCFAHDGAEQARELLASRGVDEGRLTRITDAICLHLRVTVDVRLGAVAHLLHAGAALDVVGARMADLRPAVLLAVLREYPRTDCVFDLLQAFGTELREHPTARVSRWMGLGFGRYVRRNPLDRLASGASDDQR